MSNEKDLTDVQKAAASSAGDIARNNNLPTEVQIAAVRSLGEQNSSYAVREAESIAKNNNLPTEVQIAAMEALGRMGKKRC